MATLISFLRVFINLYYMGPWRRAIIRFAEWRYRDRIFPTALDTVVTSLDESRMMDGLRAGGYSGPFHLDPSVADEIVAGLEGRRKYIVPEPHLTDLAVQRIVHDPVLQRILRQYFGTSPFLFSTSIFVTNPGGKVQNTERKACTKEFHYDLPDVKGLTLFVYLNDVDTFGGAHTVIPGTARRLTWHRLFSRFMSFPTALKTYGRDSMVTITGPKGTAFLEDLSNWHKRNVGNNTRYALAATFTLSRRPPAGREPRMSELLLKPRKPLELPQPIRPLTIQEPEKTPA